MYPPNERYMKVKKISSANVEACSLPKLFDEEKIDPEKRSREYFLDMRYKGQNHEIRVPIEKSIISSAE